MIYDKASLVQIPSGYKSGRLYSVVPNTADGDFTVTGDPEGEATRVNKDGLIETVSADVPRLNYNFIDGVVQPDPFLLLEPSRGNIYTYSEDLSQGTTLTNTSVDETSVVSPDGSLTGNKITQTSGAYLRKTLTSLSGTYAWSFFAKKGDLRYLCARTLFVQNGTTPSYSNNIIDLDTKTTAYKGTSVTSVSIIEYPNDWIKVEIIATDNATGSADLLDFFFTDNASSTASGAVGNGYLWGVQFESGSYGTSYIPNLTTGQTTRSADTVKLENFTNAPTDYPFTAFVDMDIIEDEKGYGFSFLDISSGSNYFSVGYSEDSGNLGKFRFTNRAQGTSYNFNTISTYGTGRYKIAVKFISSTNFKAFIGGVEVADYTHTSSAFNSNINDVLLGQLRVSGDVGTRNPIHQFMVFNEALSDTELETITSYKSFGQMAKALLYTIE